jgi:hypothetical protein
MMLRGYVVYFLMFAALGVGLWGVLRLGKTLEAPVEIAGEWRVQWETASPTDMGFHGVLRVDQSGRYCTFEFDETRTMSLKIIDGAVLGEEHAKLPLARLSGDGYNITLHPTAIRDAVQLEITGRTEHRGFAERLSRPSDRTAASAGSLPHTLDPVADARP